MEPDIVIRTIEEATGYRDCLGIVARERVHIALVDAPELDACAAWMKTIRERDFPFLMALAGEAVIGRSGGQGTR